MSDNKSLVSLISVSNAIELMLIESGGVLTPEIENALAVNETSIAEKIDGYAFVLERMEAMENFYKDKAEYYAKTAHQCERARERLKENLKFAMEKAGVDELVGEEIRFKKVATSGKLQITDEELIPVEFKKEVQATMVDRKALKEAAEKGYVPGANFVQGYSIRTYPNTKKLTKKDK